MESFFATLKRELAHHERYATRKQARTSVFEYIEVFYNQCAGIPPSITRRPPYMNSRRLQSKPVSVKMGESQKFVGNAKGTAYPEIRKGRFRDVVIVVPPTTLSSEFAKFANRVTRQIRILKKSTLQLTQTRDLLLPLIDE